MAGRVRRALLAAVLVAALLAASAAPAGAATGLVADETLTSAAATAPALAMAPDGSAILAWAERQAADVVVRVTVRPPGGTWSAPQTLPVELASANEIGVAIASGGAAAIAWEEVTAPSTFQVAVSTRVPGGAFAAPELLTDGRQTLDPSIGIDESGRATLLYNPTPDLVVRDFAAGTSVLSSARETLSADCLAITQHFAVAPSGDAVAGYDCGGAVFALRRAGSWAVSPKVLDDFPSGACSSVTDVSAPSVAIDAAGDAVGLLQRTTQQRIDFGLGCQTFSTSTDVSLALPLAGFVTPVPGPPAVSATTVGMFGFPVSAPTAAISPNGIVLAWGDTVDSLRARMRIRTYGVDGGGASAPQAVGSAPEVGSLFPSLALAADGRALLAWAHVGRVGEDAAVVMAERPPGGAFGEPAPVSAAGPAVPGAVVVTPAGDGAIAWTRNQAAPYELHVRGFDASAPALSGVAIPATAAAGRPAAFAAAPFDVWGPVALSWDFGDGASGAGTAPAHVYARAGRRTVTVTATDAVGNVVARSGVVRVAPGGPALSRVSLSNRAFRVGGRPTAVSARRRRPPVGTTFRFTLDRAASVTIAFTRPAPGRRARGRCVRPTRRLAGARRCTRWVAAGRLVRAASAGRGAVGFSGRVGRRALRAGRYRATLTARAGGRTSAPSALRFRVLP